MSMVSQLPSVRFYPTDAELIYFLKKFLKGESLPSECPIRLGEIYGDRPPWEISDQPEEKIGYFISPLKKRKESHKCFAELALTGHGKPKSAVILSRIVRELLWDSEKIMFIELGVVKDQSKIKLIG